MYPANIRYSKEHEWVRVEAGGIAVVGITFFAQDQMGDVVFLDLPASGMEVEQFKKVGEIESVKTVSELFSPISGRVVEVNQEVVENPEIVNKDPYDKGWLIKIALKDPSDLDRLMNAQEYQKLIVGEERSH